MREATKLGVAGNAVVLSRRRLQPARQLPAEIVRAERVPHADRPGAEGGLASDAGGRIGALLAATALSLAIVAGVGASTSSPGTALVDGIPQRGTVMGQVERERDPDPVRGPRLQPLRRVHEGRLPDDHQRLRQDGARQGRLPRARSRHPRLRAGAALHAGRVAAEEALAGRRAVLREPVAAQRARDRRRREAHGRRRQGPQREAARGRLEDACP